MRMSQWRQDVAQVNQQKLQRLDRLHHGGRQRWMVARFFVSVEVCSHREGGGEYPEGNCLPSRPAAFGRILVPKEQWDRQQPAQKSVDRGERGNDGHSSARPDFHPGWSVRTGKRKRGDDAGELKYVHE